MEDPQRKFHQIILLQASRRPAKGSYKAYQRICEFVKDPSTKQVNQELVDQKPTTSYNQVIIDLYCTIVSP